jgi:dTDP-4-dehydrorhamnose reductase
MKPLQLWGGVECTVNRVNDGFRSQLHANGHQGRCDDLRRFAGLGLRRLRYPVLWELTAPAAPGNFDWTWTDERLNTLRELRIDPIVGLVHHGSGPRYTNLLDRRFPELLAAYAHAVAARFPWVECYTPINEPLTTARFSTLYGHWYPHHRSSESFARAMVNQCRATILAMRAIREVNPAAQLIQTEDLGSTASTTQLAYQAEFENERRFLTWDLLCGRIDEKHEMWKHLRSWSIAPAELDWFREHACPPDIIGVNHYLTSDRYLDEDMPRFPPSSWGGNGRHEYADMDAVRVLPNGAPGIVAAITAAWTRYRRPVAITEAHLGCTREEQLRWLHEIWHSAQQLRDSGIDVRAVTVWSLLGSFDWNSLLTRFTGHYEPGAFDVRGPTPRPTALAVLVKELASNAPHQHAHLLDQPGWWHRSHRFLAPTLPPCVAELPAEVRQSATRRPILITGASGTLGQAFARLCELRGLDTHLCTRAELDICDAASVELAMEKMHPWAVINTAGYVRVDDAEHDPARCYRENSRGPGLLAAACAARRLPFVTFSSDLVFDGQRTTAYIETHAVRPLNVYGLSKARAEREVLRAHPDALIVRSGAFFGPWDEHNFLTVALRTLNSGREFTAMDDVIVSPTYVPDLVNAALDLLIDGERGLWHLVNQGSLSWMEFARQAAVLARVSAARLVPRRHCSAGLIAQRPTFSALASERGMLLPSLADALARYVAGR